MEKKILSAVSVPWGIDSHTPQMECLGREDGIGKVSFIADFGPHMREGCAAAEGSNVVNNPVGLDTAAGFEEYRLQKVEVSFERVYSLSMTAVTSEQGVLDDNTFDCSKIPLIALMRSDFQQFQKKYFEEWSESRKCPIPRMYEILNPGWDVDDIRVRFKLRQFLLVGHDVYSEVVAAGWSWTSLGAVLDF